MSDDFASLVVAVDSSDAAQAATDLDKLTAAGQRAETSAGKTSGAWNKAIGAIATDTSQIVKELQALNERQMATERRWLEVATATSSAAKSMDSAAASLSKVSSANVEAAKTATDVAAANKKAAESYDQARARITELAKEAVAAKEAQAQASAEFIKNAGAVKTYGDAASRAAGQTVSFNAAQDKVSTSSKGATKGLESQDAAVTNLLQSIDPLTRKLNELDRQEQELKKHRDTGRIGADVWADYQSKIDSTRAGLTRFDDSLTRTGNTAKQTAAALRGVPAQFTDIIVSLQGGQAPLTVLLQQGGQLKDMFGGVGNAAKALGGYILGLINPYTVLAAILAVVGVAYYQGSEEQDRFAKSIITTGNYAGTSTGALANMAKTISGTVGTTGAAADALSQLAAGGKITSGSFEEIATSALLFQSATGKAVSETIAEFEKIAGDPVKAIGELDDKYHFLTASVYQQIVALKEQGDAQGAAQLAEDTYAKALTERANQIKQNLGAIETAWNGVKNFAKNAWDAMLDIGREQTLADKLKKLKDDLNYIQNAKINPLSVGDNPDMVALARGEDGTKNDIAFNELQQEAEKFQNKFIGDNQVRQEESRKLYDGIRKEIADTASNEDKRNKHVLEKEREIAQARLDGYKISATEEAKLIQNIKDKYKDPATPKGPNAVDMTVFNDADNQLKAIVDSYKNKQLELESAQKAGLVSQEDYSVRRAALVTEEKDKVTAAYQAEISALESIKDRAKTTGEQRIQLDQKIADARANMTKAQLDSETKLKVIANDEVGRLAKQKASVDAYTDALNAQVVALQQQGARNAASVGMGASQKAIFDQLNAVTDKINSQRLQLASQYGDGSKGMSLEEYNQKLQALENTHNDLTRTIVANSAELKAAQSDWTNGAKSAFADYIEQAENVAALTKSAFSNAFTALEDVFTKFITTGKLSFKDFADTVIAELARIVVKQQIIAPLLKSVFGDSSTPGSGGTAGVLGGGTGSTFTDILSYGKTAVQLATSGIGSAAIAGFKAGSGIIGGLQSGGAAAYNSIVGSVTGNTAAIGGSQAGYTSSAFSNWAASGGSSAGTGAGAAAGGASGAANAGLSAGGAALYGIGGAISGYQQAGLKGAATGAAGAVGGAYAGAAIGSVVPVIGTAIGAALGAVLGGMLGGSVWGGDWVTKNQGLTLAVKDGEFDSRAYKDQKKKGGLFGSDKKRTKYSALDPETKNSLDLAYDNTQTSVEDLFKTLNVKVNEGILDGLDVGVLKISTKDNTPEEVQKKITEWFSGVADKMVGAINTGATAGLEGYNFESLTAFVNNLVSVNQVLTNLDVGVFDFSVSGGKMAEQLSVMAGGFEALKTNAATYYENFYTDAEKSDDILEAVRKQFAAINVSLPTTRDGFRDAVKAIDITTESGRAMFATLTGLSGNAAQAYTILEQREQAATKAAEEAAAAEKTRVDTMNANYYATFATDTEKADDKLKEISANFAKLGVELPKTTLTYREMVTNAGLAGESGKALFEALKTMGADAYEYINIIRQRAMDSATAAFGVLQRSIQAQQKAATKAFNDQMTALNDQVTKANSNISGLTSIASSLDAALKSLRGTSDDAVLSLRAQARATLDAALAQAQGGKSLVGFEGLDDALDTASNMDPALYASLNEFAIEQGETTNVIDQLNKLNGKQLTAEQQSLDYLKQQIDLAQKAYDKQNDAWQAQLDFGQSQIDAMNNVDNSVKTVADAVRALNAAITATLQYRPDSGVGSAKNDTPANNAAYVNSVYQQYLGRQGDAAGVSFWTQQLQSGNLTYDQLISEIQKAASTNPAEQAYAVKGHAMGTGASTASGWMTVGEQGPELINTGPATIKSNSQSKKFLNDNQAMFAAKLDAFISNQEKQINYLWTTAKNTGTSATKLDEINERQAV